LDAAELFAGNDLDPQLIAVLAAFSTIIIKEDDSVTPDVQQSDWRVRPRMPSQRIPARMPPPFSAFVTHGIQRSQSNIVAF